MTPEIRAEIVRYRISKAHQLLVEIRKMMELEMWNSAVNRMYYACFHSASALLIKKGIDSHTHKGLRQNFNAHIVKNGYIVPEEARVLMRVYDKRQAADYDDFIDCTREEIEALYPSVELFIRRMQELLDKE
ncbi:MAG: HEPN domain-containing protein [Bacteroides sp.]|nr:HEPN domain-containing protein [Bacteroides sp.]MDE6812878.1 HEPN domain-containing protein [Duncaniella sp.]MDE6825040.1 HEPN domain-containing protein [Duncaniella sp.]